MVENVGIENLANHSTDTCPNNILWESLHLDGNANAIRAVATFVANCVLLAFSVCFLRTSTVLVSFVVASFKEVRAMLRTEDEDHDESRQIIDRYTGLLQAFAVDHVSSAIRSTDQQQLQVVRGGYQRIAYGVLVNLSCRHLLTSPLLVHLQPSLLLPCHFASCFS
jgi:hypothetical protein